MRGHQAVWHPDGRTLEFSFHGLWGDAERGSWASEFAALIPTRRPGFCFLVDFSDYPPQEPATQLLHQQMMTLALDRGLHAAVHIVPSAVVRHQMKRASDATPQHARFRYAATMADGLRILHAVETERDHAVDHAVGAEASAAAAPAAQAPNSPMRIATGPDPMVLVALRSRGAAIVVANTLSLAAVLVSGRAGLGPGIVAALACAATAFVTLVVPAALSGGDGVRRGGRDSVRGSGRDSVRRGGRDSDRGSGRDSVRGADRRSPPPGNGFAHDAAEIADIQHRATSLAAHARHLHERGVTLADVATEADGASREIVADATRMAERLQSVAADTAEMAASISEIHQQTAWASRLTIGAADEAQRTRELVAALDTSSREIGQVVSLIRTIAGQTNMLALNATIEAARAGEAGRGFAVVATEVKGLSQATAGATKQIEDRVRAIQQNVVETVAAIDHIAGVVAEVNGAQSAVSAAVDGQLYVTTKISQAVEGTTADTAAMVDRIRTLALTTSEVSAAASVSTEIATELTTLGTQVSRLVAGHDSGAGAGLVHADARDGHARAGATLMS